VKILCLLARHFLLCLRFWWVELQIRVISRFSVSLVRWQVRLLHFSGYFGVLAFSLLPLAFFTGCATHNAPQHTYAPSSAPILRAVTAAKQSAAALKSQVSTPEGLRTLAELNQSLDSSLTEVAAYSSKVDQLSVSLTKAEESAIYWREKQQKALRELWIWRGLAAVAISCIAAWLAWRIYKPAFL
jgi:hypothetical protein